MSYEQTLVKIIEPVKRTTITRMNRSKKWQYGYNKEHDIIWLLDNDAVVESDTLFELVKVAQQDEEVGIVGSMIMEPDKDMIVELGASVSWPIGTWMPNLRSKLLSNFIPPIVSIIRNILLNINNSSFNF